MRPLKDACFGQATERRGRARAVWQLLERREHLLTRGPLLVDRRVPLQRGRRHELRQRQRRASQHRRLKQPRKHTHTHTQVRQFRSDDGDL